MGLRMDDSIKRIIVPKSMDLLAGFRSDGSPVNESVIVEQLDEHVFKMLKSPGFVPGLAAGDTFKVLENGRFQIVSRSRNIAVQLFFPEGVEITESVISESMTVISGYLDGRSQQLLVYTVPFSVGFAAIQSCMQGLTEKFHGLEWYYGNVYDPKDGVTPLNWWLESSPLND